MTRIEIDTTGSGATMSGTTRDMAPMLGRRGLGWRWSGRTGCWYLPSTFRPSTVDGHVDRTVRQLREAGYDVKRIDGPRDEDEERARRRRERDRALVDVHDQRAARAQAEHDSALARARRMASGIPLGQPILAGHHSERRDRRYRERIRRTYDKAGDARRRAEEERCLAAAARERVASAERADEAPPIDAPPADVKAGWWVHVPGGWVRALRINRKSVTVPGVDGLESTETVPWHKVKAVAEPDTDPTPKAFWHRDDRDDALAAERAAKAARPKKQISRTEWRKTPRDYRTGNPRHGTAAIVWGGALVPVDVVADDELDDDKGP